MMMSRRLTDSRRPLLQRFADAVTHVANRQSEFSIVSAALASVLAVTMAVDVVVGHPHMNRGAVIVWLASYSLFTFLPLAFGYKYPRSAGLVLVGFLTFWSTYSLVWNLHPQMELNALVEAPMVAIYVGWFFRAWFARAILAFHLICISLAVLLRPPHPDDDSFSSGLALAYAIVIAIFCLETGVFIRRRAGEEARRDPLTGALNRRGLADASRKLFAAREHDGLDFSLAVIDLDDFKEVNDAGGHAVGDRVLRECVESWLEGLDHRDLIARIGGDEFVLLINDPEVVANGLLASINHESQHAWSWGIAQYRPGDSLESLMRRADVALYEHKESRKLN